MPVMSRFVNGSTRSFGQRGAVVPIDPYFRYVTLLLSTSSLTNADNSRFLDSSSSYTPISRNGNVSQGSFSPFDPNWSNYFDGSGDFLSVPNNTAFSYGTGDFTMEAWVYKSGSGSMAVVDSNTSGSGGGTFGFSIQDTTISGYQTNVLAYTFTATVPLNTWTHIAFTRTGGNLTCYVNGTSVGSQANSANFTSSNAIIIGRNAGSGTEQWLGYISNLRIVKGTAVYTGNFAPPAAPLAAVSGTSLLTCQANRLIDASTNNFTITKNGDTSVSPFSPFTFSKPGAVYNQNDISNYSVFFDGSSYLSAPDSSNYTLGSGSFVFETFVNFTSLPTSGGAASFLTQWYDGTLGWWFYLYNNAGTYQLIFSYSTNGSNQTNVSVNLSAAPTLNTWNHVAFFHISGIGLGIYWNGVQIGTFQTIGATIFDAASAIQIGARVGSGGAGYYLNGYMSNMRLGRDVSGSWLWPPTSKVPVRTGTVLLALQDPAFSDNSTTKAIFTPVGNPRITGANPFQAGFYSNYFDGSGDYLSAPNNAAFNFGTGDFTAECWVFQTNNAAYQRILSYGQFAATGNFQLEATSDTSITVHINGGYISTTVPSLLNTWTHIAVVRTGGSVALYTNGVLRSTNSQAGNVSTANVFAVAGQSDGTNNFYGYVSNVRVVKGTAVYTGAFTPSTTPLTAVSGTSLLTCQSNRFLDNSTNAFTITPAGNTAVQTRNPFYTATVASAGGSAYFDGSGDWLSLADSPDWDFTGDFTVEAWVYPLTGGVNRTIMSTYASPSSGWMLRTDAGAALNFTWGDSLIVGTTAPLTLNAWNHVAATRSGTTARMFLNGALVATATDSTNLTNSSPLYIGTLNTANLGWMMNGYMAGMRIVNGKALYTAAFTPPTAPLTPDGNTTLLVNGMNAGIYDAAMMNNLGSEGDTKVSSVQAKYGGTSIYFDGNGDYLAVSPTSSILHSFGTGDFTIECWAYVNSISTYGGIIDARSGATQSNYALGVWNNSGNKLDFLYGTTRLTSTSTFSTGSWVHFAVTRASGTIRLFINGVLDASTATFTGAIDSNRTQPLIGAVQDPYYLNGYIDDLRITKGYARYTTSFGPPARALPIR